jgi:hypothetical protein
MNRWIGGLEVGFRHWRPQGGNSPKNVECLRRQRRQREEGDRDASHLRPQFMIVMKKHDIGNISRTEGRLIARLWPIVGNNRRIQKIMMKLKWNLCSGPSKVMHNFWTKQQSFERWILNNGGCKNNNNIETLIFTKVDGNGLIGAAGCYHILAVRHRPVNESVRPDSFIF